LKGNILRKTILDQNVKRVDKITKTQKRSREAVDALSCSLKQHVMISSYIYGYTTPAAGTMLQAAAQNDNFTQHSN
jgi:hypothetical protein